jgi:hypothetical protein
LLVRSKDGTLYADRYFHADATCAITGLRDSIDLRSQHTTVGKPPIKCVRLVAAYDDTSGHARAHLSAFGGTGVGIWSATVLLMLASIFGIRVALQPQRHHRSGFIHAHIALIATGLTMGQAAVAQAGLSNLAMPQFQQGDWSFLPLSHSPLGTFLFISVFSACICCHLTIINRIKSA